MDPRLLEALRCPVCYGSLSVAGRALRCGSGHNFDIARQGYVDLAGGRVTHGGDTAEMVAARQAVLARGHFDFLTEALLAAAAPYPTGLIVDVGAGTGHYLAALLTARGGELGVALDVSKPALRRSARAHPRLAAVRADIWRGLPVADAAATLVLNVFAPRHGAEFARVLRPDGRLLVVTPSPEHLYELAPPVTVDTAKQRRLDATLGEHFVSEFRHQIVKRAELSHVEAVALLAMGPSAAHTTPERLTANVAELPDPVAVTEAVQLSVWRRI
jgi:23S rRNA (guanine745-N1)-methyltransferase